MRIIKAGDKVAIAGRKSPGIVMSLGRDTGKANVRTEDNRSFVDIDIDLLTPLTMLARGIKNEKKNQ